MIALKVESMFVMYSMMVSKSKHDAQKAVREAYFAAYMNELFDKINWGP